MDSSAMLALTGCYRYAEELCTALELPEGWGRSVDSRGDEYFFHKKSNKSQWELPEGADYTPSKSSLNRFASRL